MSFSLSPGSSVLTTNSFLVSYMSAVGAHTRSIFPEPFGWPRNPSNSRFTWAWMSVKSLDSSCENGRNRISAMSPPPVLGPSGPSSDLSLYDLYMLSVGLSTS